MREATPEITWKSLLAEDMRRALAADPWSRVLFGMAWTHLGLFLVCHRMFDPKVTGDLRFPALWVVEFVALLAIMRAVGGKGWSRRSPAQGLVLRVWVTMMILSFNVATLNALTGWQLDWFKPVWATLSTFLFATLAWLFTPRFLILAVQMYLTGLLMVKLPEWNYLIFGVSWWVALHAVGVVLWRRERAASRAAEAQAARPASRRHAEAKPRPALGGEPALVGLD
jgi:hypothetical protein